MFNDSNSIPNIRQEENVEEVFELSPFEVNPEKDVGFVATQSLAGGRLAGDLKETPAAYSVLTKEFVDAVGITSLEEANQWVVGGNEVTDNSQETIAGGLSSGRTFSITLRGTNSAIPQKNFFPFGTVYDSFNIERFDFGRDPNSILFGNGGIGGSANIASKKAVLGKNKTIIGSRFGSWNDKRLTLDHNFSVNERFAVRLNAVWQDSETWRDNEYDKKEGIALAATYKFAENTEFRLEGEHTKTRKRRSQSWWLDSFSGWDGTTFDGSRLTKDAWKNGVWRQRNGGEGATGRYWLYSQSSGTHQVVDYLNSPVTAASAKNGKTKVGGVVLAPDRWELNYHTKRSAFKSQNLPDYIYDVAKENSAFFIPSDEFTVVSPRRNR